MKDLLIKLDACQDAKDWAADKSWQEIFETCHRGDWLLWLFQKTNPNDLQALTLAKGHCANTIRHLMKDERSIKAIDIAIAFGEGKASLEELHSAAASSAVASYVASSAVASAAAASYDAASYAASYVAYAAAAASYAAASADAVASYDAASSAVASYVASSAARKENQQLTADICRKYLPIEIWNI